MLKALSQRDLRWCNQKLGKSKLTVGAYGCLTTALCMMADYFGHYTDPGVYASQVKHYDANGLLIWGAIDIPGFKYESVEEGRNDKKIQLYLKDPNKAVILQVNDGHHWVLGARKNLIGSSYTVLDPWMGDTCDVIKRYHNITKMAFFHRA